MYITKDEFDNLSWEVLNGVLERIHNHAIEETLKHLPEIIIGLVVKTKGINQTMEAFKLAHPALSGRENELMEIIQELELSNGALSLEDILKEVPKRMESLFVEIPTEQPHTIEEVERTANGFI